MIFYVRVNMVFYVRVNMVFFDRVNMVLYDKVNMVFYDTVNMVFYGRSYVVRHVRDTHRDKPLRVVDLLKNGEVEENLDESDELNDSGDTTVDTDGLEVQDDVLDKGTIYTILLMRSLKALNICCIMGTSPNTGSGFKGNRYTFRGK